MSETVLPFDIGDRVRVKLTAAAGFAQPWRDRFMAGRAGTVVSGPSANIRGILVEFDAKRKKYPHEWRLVLGAFEIEHVEDTQ